MVANQWWSQSLSCRKSERVVARRSMPMARIVHRQLVLDWRHVTDDGNWNYLKILQEEKLQIGGGFLAPSQDSGGGGFDLEHGLKTIVIESDEAMHELCGDQIAILLDYKNSTEPQNTNRN